MLKLRQQARNHQEATKRKTRHCVLFTYTSAVDKHLSQQFCTIMACSSSNSASVVAMPKQLSHDGVNLYGFCFIGLICIGLVDKPDVGIRRTMSYSCLVEGEWCSSNDQKRRNACGSITNSPADGQQEVEEMDQLKKTDSEKENFMILYVRLSVRTYIRGLILRRARRDSNPRPNAQEAFALSMLSYEPALNV